jgi:DNA end-binding protein Ku
MAPRPSWHGYLKLSLVTCPVAMLPATSEAEKVRFHTLNRATGNRVRVCYVDAETGKPVDDEDQVKGYEREDGEYVMLEDEELQAVALESARSIDIDCFVPTDTIGWIWYDTPHYLIPEDKVGEEAFSVIREAMVTSDTRAISRVVPITASAPCCSSPATRAWSCGRCATAMRCMTKPSTSKELRASPIPGRRNGLPS